MNKTLIFLNLRLRQLKSDKTALFFCYILPVILLLGIGYPLHQAGTPKVSLYYSDTANNTASHAFVEYLKEQSIIELLPDADLENDPMVLLEKDDIKHYVEITDSSNSIKPVNYHLYSNAMESNIIENIAVKSVVEKFFVPTTDVDSELETIEVSSDNYKSYIVTLLPGLIGMTFLIIGLNGFGGVLIEEQNRGLFKNLKTIDASPIPFLAGLFISRLIIAYTVAMAMYAIGVFVFDINPGINLFLLSLIVLIASAAFLGLGLVLAVLSPSVNAFNGIVNFVQLTFIVLGGVFFSIATFPDWVQSIAHAIPLIHINTALQQVFFEGLGLSGVKSISVELSVMLAWAIITLVIGWRKFKW